jgi:hypothetical protein
MLRYSDILYPFILKFCNYHKFCLFYTLFLYLAIQLSWKSFLKPNNLLKSYKYVKTNASFSMKRAICMPRLMFQDIKSEVHDKWVPVTTTWRVLSLRMDERPPIWKASATILNKQSWQPTSGGLPAWRSSKLLTTPHPTSGLVTKRIHLPRAWTDPLVRPKQL